jgi:transcriptional regulator with XRE-family HTH domain
MGGETGAFLPAIAILLAPLFRHDVLQLTVEDASKSLRRAIFPDLGQCCCAAGLSQYVGRFLDPEAMINTVRKKAPNSVDQHVGSRVRMRRMMLAMSQTTLGNALGLTFQQVQKYEKGTNRIGASRLQHISQILQVPVAFLFEGAPSVPGTPQAMEMAPSPAYVTDFLATSDGLALTKAFMLIKNTKLKQRIVELVKEIAVDHDH